MSVRIKVIVCIVQVSTWTGAHPLVHGLLCFKVSKVGRCLRTVAVGPSNVCMIIRTRASHITRFRQLPTVFLTYHSFRHLPAIADISQHSFSTLFWNPAAQSQRYTNFKRLPKPCLTGNTPTRTIHGGGVVSAATSPLAPRASYDIDHRRSSRRTKTPAVRLRHTLGHQPC
jgi:hypothetical protein